VLERAAELDVEHGVEDGVDGRVGVAEPEQEGIQPVRKIGQQLMISADAAGHVDCEEAEPHSTEDADDDG